MGAKKQAIKDILARLPLKDLKADAFGKDKTKEYFDRPE
jgi:hypothetical protein